MNRCLIGNIAGLIGAGMLFIPASPSHADNATNTAPSRPPKEFSLTLSAGHDNSPSNNYYGLSKDAFDRLSPEQITALAKAQNAQSGNLSDTISSILIPVAMFTCIGVGIWLGTSSRLKRQRLLHETLQRMIEKGQPIPPELLRSDGSRRSPRCDLRNGLILLGIGAGLAVLFLVQHDENWPVALIPLLMGVAFLITWKIESNQNGQPK